MKIKYDKKTDALYFALAKGNYSDSIKISDNILVDKSTNGKILGIEVLDASLNIPAFNPHDVKFRVQTV